MLTFPERVKFGIKVPKFDLEFNISSFKVSEYIFMLNKIKK